MNSKRFFMCILGVTVCAISVAFFKLAAFGVDPFQTFMSGIDSLIPISYGTLYIIACAVLLIFALIADRHYIGLATIINLTIFGYITQFSLEILSHIFPDPSLTIRIICLAVGIITMCYASAFYFVSDLGVSPYDAVALIIANTWKIGKFSYVRIISDFCCVVIGTILYYISYGTFSGITAVVGVGTIITAFFMGPLIEFFKVHCAEPFLHASN